MEFAPSSMDAVQLYPHSLRPTWSGNSIGEFISFNCVNSVLLMRSFIVAAFKTTFRVLMTRWPPAVSCMASLGRTGHLHTRRSCSTSPSSPTGFPRYLLFHRRLCQPLAQQHRSFLRPPSRRMLLRQPVTIASPRQLSRLLGVSLAQRRILFHPTVLRVRITSCPMRAPSVLALTSQTQPSTLLLSFLLQTTLRIARRTHRHLGQWYMPRRFQ